MSGEACPRLVDRRREVQQFLIPATSGDGFFNPDESALSAEAGLIHLHRGMGMGNRLAAKAVPDEADDTLAQGVRRFRCLSVSRPEIEGFADRPEETMSKIRD